MGEPGQVWAVPPNLACRAAEDAGEDALGHVEMTELGLLRREGVGAEETPISEQLIPQEKRKAGIAGALTCLEPDTEPLGSDLKFSPDLTHNHSDSIGLGWRSSSVF